MKSAKSVWLLAITMVIGAAMTASTHAQLGPGAGAGDGDRGSLGNAPEAEKPAQGGQGACCLGNGNCVFVSQVQCDTILGVFQGVGVACADAGCVPFGACCFPDLTCLRRTEIECAVAGGDYQGDATKCVLGQCPINGACCLDDGSCLEQQTHNECQALGGLYQGFLTTCAGVTCTGACTFDDGTCLDGLSDDACVAMGGNFQSPGITCANTNAPAIVFCMTFSFNQNGMRVLNFPQFDDAGGTRVLQAARMFYDAEIIAAVQLTNLADNFVDTEVQVTEAVFLDFPAFAPAPFVAVDIPSQIINCGDGFLLPPGDSCDFDSPLVFGPGAGMDTALPPDLGPFVGAGTISTTVSGTGNFEYDGSKFILEQDPHRVQGKVRLVYEYLVVGACCFDDGTCQVLIEPDCVAMGGIYQGEGTDCGTTECPQACCLRDGTCDFLTPTDCLGVGGDPQGIGTNCASVECPQACCLRDGTCTFVTPTECLGAGGDPQGDGTNCATVACPQGCCFEDGSCLFLRPAECALAGGTPSGDGTNCATANCPQPGACCLPDGTCVQSTVVGGADCTAQGGDYRGDGTTCATVNCDVPGACCLTNGDCIQATEVGGADCVAQGGDYQGDNTLCADVICPQPGACCLADGTCVTATVIGGADCTAQGGIYQGDDTDCATVVCDQPGACCLPDGTCVQATQLGGADCLAQGGDYQGDGTLCALIQCPQACCFDDGSCQFITQLACIAQGGTPQGVGTNCAITCPQPGACCLTDGTCIQAAMLGGADCVAQGGDYRGDDTLCVDVSCPQPGACCLTDGSCVLAAEIGGADCTAQGGVYQDDDTTCAAVVCPQPGACCLPDGTCVMAAEIGGADCTAQGGDYQGDDTSCAAIECPQGCCFDDGSCLFLRPAECTVAGGTPAGVGTNCATANCPQPGACCLTDGTCIQATTVGGADCTAAGGTYQGDGTTCAGVVCPQPGACCLPTGSCIQAAVLGGADCTAAGGVYQGDGTLCAAVDCPQACCLPDGSCDFRTVADCNAAGGLPQGDGTNCATIVCPTQACCFAVAPCADLTPESCLAMGGTPQGMGSMCATADCPQLPERGGCTEKGSLLLFSKVELRWDQTGAAVLQDTFISLTNDNNQDVRVKMYFINGDEPLAMNPDTGERAHPGWNWVNNQIELTANQPTFWSALTGQPAQGGLSPFTVLDPGFPPGRPANDGTTDRVLRGFILAWAVNRDSHEIKWNHLSGAGTLVNYGRGSSWEYNACAFAAVDDMIMTGDKTGTPGKLNLDGEEFAQAWDQLLVNFQASGSAAFSGPVLVQSDTDLTIHPVSTDIRQENDGPVTTKASFTVWNQNEVKFSGMHRCVTCWDQTLLSQYDLPNHFILQNLQTDHGKARVDGVASNLCNFDFDQGDGLPIGDDPRDILSQDAALTGVAARFLTFDGGQPFDAAGYNLIGVGFQDAMIQYDIPAPPLELVLPPNPSLSDIDAFIEAWLIKYHFDPTP